MQDLSVNRVNVTTYDRGENHLREDMLAVEEPLEINLAPAEGPAVKVSITMRTPGNDEELALGFLFTEGVISSFADIHEIRPAPAFPDLPSNNILIVLEKGVEMDAGKLNRNFYTTSSCGVCGKASIDAIHTTSIFQKNQQAFVVSDPQILTGLPGKLREAQDTFEKTGGLHASALFSASGELILLREDVGRHNALDKLIGRCLMDGNLPLDHQILLLSGRASFELIQKAAMAGIRCVAAVGAPSSLAVETAQSFGIQLYGFLKEQRFNRYC